MVVTVSYFNVHFSSLRPSSGRERCRSRDVCRLPSFRRGRGRLPLLFYFYAAKLLLLFFTFPQTAKECKRLQNTFCKALIM